MTAEEQRLAEAEARTAPWRRWGAYLSERAWGTVREDYSASGSAWHSFPHDHARSRVYRWNEDGLAGICDRRQLICFALALWNERDPILKERLFGLNGHEGNHGEDVKESYFYLDATPTHSYLKFLYKYPQAAFPYAELVAVNQRRGKHEPEYELPDTGVFNEGRYFDVFVEYAKAAPEDILIRLEIINRGPETAQLHVLPTIWFRNTWSWGWDAHKPRLHQCVAFTETSVIELQQERYGQRWLYCAGQPALLFTENESNLQRLYGVENRAPYVKDGINDFLVSRAANSVNPAGVGTKASAHYPLTLSAGARAVLQLRLSDQAELAEPFGAAFDAVFTQRRQEADEFYARFAPPELSSDARAVQRQAFAGMIWSQQFYHYNVNRWLRGDPAQAAAPAARRRGRNHEWGHLNNADVISMPDTWEYPWYAVWDLAFHCLPLALIDPAFAKRQLSLFLRERYQHPNGALPAYEWNFNDVNPPVHAWAVWRVYRIEERVYGRRDREFLESAFHKLLLNFTWWVNRKDAEGNNVFEGGFLGLDNIGLFDRSQELPGGGHLEQADGTGWMAMYCLNMLVIALELARDNPAYEAIASKFFEHFVRIAHALNHLGEEDLSLWDTRDGFYYDALHLPDGHCERLRVRSMVGLIPLFAVETLDAETLERLPNFKRRMRWFIENEPEFSSHLESRIVEGGLTRYLLALATPEQLRRVLGYALDESEFLSPYGIRSLSQYHRAHPYELRLNGAMHRIQYEPGESQTGMFGGNSNWRGPIWFPVNYLFIESLQKYHYYLGDDFQVECPSGSGRSADLWNVASDLSQRLSRLFLRNADEQRPIYGAAQRWHDDPHWRDWVLFYEYFDGDTGYGLGASHQTGWTGLIAKLLEQAGRSGSLLTRRLLLRANG